LNSFVFNKERREGKRKEKNLEGRDFRKEKELILKEDTEIFLRLNEEWGSKFM